MICYICKENKSDGEVGEIVFGYLGMSVKIFKWGSLCKDCAEAEWIKDFENTNAREFFYVFAGKPTLDWPRYKESGFIVSGGRSDLTKLHDILKDIGVFSCEAKGNWEIVALGRLNPRGYTGQLYYFTNERDATEFAHLRSHADLEIHHIDKVIYEAQIERIRGGVGTVVKSQKRKYRIIQNPARESDKVTVEEVKKYAERYKKN
ncbi:MAG: hypothetical protein Q7R84_01565, partial [bacterium]|nr:hypothetical protein [bacterium]